MAPECQRSGHGLVRVLLLEGVYLGGAALSIRELEMGRLRLGRHICQDDACLTFLMQRQTVDLQWLAGLYRDDASVCVFPDVSQDVIERKDRSSNGMKLLWQWTPAGTFHQAAPASRLVVRDALCAAFGQIFQATRGPACAEQ